MVLIKVKGKNYYQASKEKIQKSSREYFKSLSEDEKN